MIYSLVIIKFNFLADSKLLDVDECSYDRCHQNASCINEVGSFICDCNDGFVGNGLNCEGNRMLQKYVHASDVTGQKALVIYIFKLLQISF